MIKKIIKKNNLLLFAVLAFIVAGISDNNLLNNKNILFDVGYFQEKIIEKDNKLSKDIKQINNWLNNRQVKYLFINKLFDYDKKYYKEGEAFLVYKNDSLKFWSNNSFSLHDNLNTFKNNKPVIFLGNAWFLLEKEVKNDITIIGLLKLKQKYEYENEFLKNKFQSDFLTPPNTKIVTDENLNGIKIYNKHKKYLFSLQLSQVSNYINHKNGIAVTFYLIGFTLLFLFLCQLNIKGNYKLLILLVFLAFTRYVLLKFQIPKVVFLYNFFKPEFYTASVLTPTLGDFIIHAIMILYFSIAFYKFFNLNVSNSTAKKSKYIIIATFIVLINFIIIQLYRIVEDLIVNSSMSYEVYKIEEFTSYTFVGFVILTFLIISFVLLIFKFAKELQNIISFRYFIGLFLVASIVIMIVVIVFNPFGIIPVIALLLLVAVIFYAQYYRNLGFISTVIIVGLIALFTFLIISEESLKKEKNQRKVLAEELAAEHDPVAEFLLENVEEKIKKDLEINEIISAGNFDFEKLYDHIQKRYFIGFWSKYNLQITVCTPFDSLLIQPDQQWKHCYGFFDKLVKEQGEKLENSDFYFLDNQSGQITYFGYFTYFTENSPEISIYIQLESKLISEELGYPELLYNTKIPLSKDYANYSYAKYKHDNLISQNGKYLYSLNLKTYGKHNQEFTFFKLNGYNHLLYNVNNETSIIISKLRFTFFDGLISFSYLFVYFYLLALIFVTIDKYKKGFNYSLSFTRRIQFSMISILLLSLLLIGGGTIIYNIKEYQFRHYKSISEKLQSVLVELKHKLAYEDELDPLMNEYITTLLIKFSNVFYSDINIYDLNGNLYATSRPEIFNRQLISRKMNPEAYAEVGIKKQVEFIHDEKIGLLKFASAYVPFHNEKGKLLAYLNLPYFSKQGELSEEISTFVVAIVNIYVLLIIFTIIIAVFISREITRPIKLISEKFKVIDFSKNNEQIHYKGKDEISSLVNEYNRMVVELKEKAELLAKSERETAWREMAKQIAHEIKNPLTPMKLNVQLLEKIWKDKDENFEEHLNKITQSLIEQINSLSAIATEFSGFAKMPKPQSENLNLIEILKDSITLFENATNIKFKYNFDNLENILVFADREQLLRVFNNLIKNSVQALTEIENPVISINVTTLKHKTIVEINDNGKGIRIEMKDKLFQPSFTTKTSGMGLGLAIVKNIVENLGGKIWFETELNKGTSFFIELTASESKK
ncbi:MAG: GHKL domain-containing protein [Chlorobi bacterium]|nr:GHKL domain-containing protein [Chlorobiota bacterium]